MKHSIKHSFKRALVGWKIFPLIRPIIQPIYDGISDGLGAFSPNNKNRRRKMLGFYSQFIKKGDLCFDIGANRGSRTEIFLRLGAKVIVVEPQERCYRYLEKKFGNNPNVILINKGLSDKEEELTLSICEEADSISTFSEEWKTGRFSDYKWNKKQLISCTTLDNLIKDFGLPVFCKIDVEGFEQRVLKGLSRPIKYLSFEFDKKFFKKTTSCLSHILSLGPALFNCDLYESMRLFFGEWVTDKDICEKIDNFGDNLLAGDIYVKFLDK